MAQAPTITPIFVDLTADTWIKVATNVTRGQVSIITISTESILTTYRTTGDLAVPTLISEGIPMSKKSSQIISRNPIDVYMYSQDKESKVRVDL